MGKQAHLSLVKQPPEGDEPLTATALRQRLQTQAAAVATLADEWGGRDKPISFKDFEKALRELVFAFARVAIMLFLALREEHVVRAYPSQLECAGRRFRRAPAIPRSLTTLFGVVRYARTYMREIGHGARRGFHPLDLALGLVGDRFSWNVLTMSARLATKLSFAEARTTLASFIPDAPSTEVIEQTVLGLGRHTADWFAQAPAPEGDGEVLVIMFDGKGAPTATESELQRRRGKRRRQRLPASPRHRGRHRRRRYGKKPRRNKGDKSKNARMATMVVMFTLKRHGTKLLGPINRKLYASFAPKKHAFAIARREATKRGFGPGCGNVSVRSRASCYITPSGAGTHRSRLRVRYGGYWTMQNGIDTWFLESMFAHFRMAAHLVDNIDDTIVADELAKSISEISRRVAALLGKPYGPPAEGESPGSQAAGEPTKDGESDEPDLANMLDDVCDSVARADAFASAAKSLIREISAEENGDNHRFARLAHFIDATAEAMQEADDVGHVLVVKFAQRRPGHDGAS